MEMKNVTLGLKEDTIEAVENIREKSGLDNKTQIVVDSVALAEWAIDKNAEDAEIYAEYPDGSREKVILSRLFN